MKKLAVFFSIPIVKLTWVFLKIGLVFFGGGYVVIPVLHRELVTNLHWLTERQFIDGTAISQLTPGPVAVLATFSGFIVAGIPGALVATFAAFLPGSLLMIFLSHSYSKLHKLESVRFVLNTLIPVIVGLLLAAAFNIGTEAGLNIISIIMFVISLVLLIRFKINPLFLIIASAIAGWLLKM